jgi:hypothetical protein
MNDQAQNDMLKDVKEEFRKKLVGAVVASIIAGVGAALFGVWTYMKQLPGEAGLAPKGMVAAFDLEKGCPKGWEPYEDAKSRTIVGADPRNGAGAVNTDENGQRLSSWKFEQTGGEEAHVLTTEELAPHVHSLNNFNGVQVTYSDKFSNALIHPSHDRVNFNGQTMPEGKGKPHNNKPPFIALYYCKKT